MAGPMIGMLNQIGGAMFSPQVGQALGGLAGEVISASDLGFPLTPPAGRAVPTPRSSPRASRLRGRRAALPGAARVRPPAALPARAVAARPHHRRDRGLRPRHHDRHLQDRGGSGLDPSNMEAMQEALDGGLFDPEQTPPQKAALTGWRPRSPWSRAGSTRSSARPPPSGCPTRQAARGGPPPPRHRRTRRGDVRHAGRARAAAAPAARRLRAVGPLRSRQGAEARDAVWAHPDLLPDGRRPRRPAGLPRGPRGGRRAERRGVRRRALRACWTRSPAAPTTSTGVTRRERAVRRRGRRAQRWPAPSPSRTAARGVRRAPRAHPDGLRACHPDHLTASALVSRRPHQVLLNLHRKSRWVPVRRPLRAGRRHPGRGRAARGHRGVRRRRARARRRRRSSTARRTVLRPARPSPPPRRPLRGGAPGRRARVSDESLDVGWWPVDALPTDEPDMHDLSTRAGG